MDKMDWHYYTGYSIGIFIDLIVIWAVVLGYIEYEEGYSIYEQILYSLFNKAIIGIIMCILLLPFSHDRKLERWRLWDKIKLHVCLPMLPCLLLAFPLGLLFLHIGYTDKNLK